MSDQRNELVLFNKGGRGIGYKLDHGSARDVVREKQGAIGPFSLRGRRDSVGLCSRRAYALGVIRPAVSLWLGIPGYSTEAALCQRQTDSVLLRLGAGLDQFSEGGKRFGLRFLRLVG